MDENYTAEIENDEAMEALEEEEYSSNAPSGALIALAVGAGAALGAGAHWLGKKITGKAKEKIAQHKEKKAKKDEPIEVKEEVVKEESEEE